MSINARISLAEFIARNSQRIWGKDDGTSRNHVQRSLCKLERFCQFADFGQRFIDEIQSEDVLDFLDFIAAEPTCRCPNGVSTVTQNRYVAALSSLFKHAKAMNRIEHVPLLQFQKVSKHDKHKRRYLTDDELNKLEHFLGTPSLVNRGAVYADYSYIKHFVTIGINTGMRLGEIRSIMPTNIETDASGTWICLTKTKNGDDRRVPANTSVVTALRALNDSPAQYWSEWGFYETMRRARDYVAKGDNTFVFHALRHTAASALANDLKINTILIARLLGHKSLKTTESYVHSKPEALADAAAQLHSLRFSRSSQH